MPDIAQMMTSLATGLETQLGGVSNPVIPDLQVDDKLVPNPTPPCIDVYPAQDLFTEQIGFGQGQRAYYFTVRARVSTADNEGGQALLLSMMDDESVESVEDALLGVSGVRTVEGPTGYGVFRDVGTASEWLGCTWRVQMIP